MSFPEIRRRVYDDAWEIDFAVMPPPENHLRIQHVVFELPRNPPADRWLRRVIVTPEGTVSVEYSESPKGNSNADDV